MKTFFKDYGQLCKQSGAFCKKHWLGIINLTLVGYALGVLMVWPKELRKEWVDEIKSKFKKESKEES